jgi:hypothetical protein
VDAGVCSAPHCFDNQRNFDETQVDCGGSCGSECPVCSGDKSFQSFESGLSDWTLPYWGGGPANTELSNDATDGAHSLAYLACGYQELWSTFPASAFEIVGDQLLLDFKFRVADPASLGIGAWLGSITVSLRTPEGQLTTLQPEKAFYRGSENQWLTLSMPVPSALEAALLDDRSGFRFEIALNRACPVGSANDAILLDRLRFSGNAEFRSLCGSDSGGSGGASGTGGGLGTGGSSSGGGTGTGGTSSGGTGGSSTGGTGGSGGTTGNAALIFDFESVSAWLSYQQVPVLSSGEHTSGQHGLDVGTINGTWAEFESTVFSAQDVAETSLLLVDAKLPPAAPYNTIGGTVEVIFECPSAGLWWGSLGTASLAGLPSGEWTALALTVNDQVKAALGTSANDCKLRFRSSIWGQQANSHIYYDNIRFAQPSVCTSYAQITTPPYSVGQPVPGDGTDARPYPLCNAAQLQQLLLTPALWSKSFALQADVDLIGVTGSLGTAVTPFTGRFDGRAHILRNYALTAGDDVGFFGVVQGAVIHDLRLANFTVSGHDNVGAFVGRGSFYAYRITVAGGTVSGTGAQIGGLIGTNEGSIDTSSSSALVSAVGASRVGGAVGYNQGELNNVSAAGAVQLSGATGTAVGGLVGENNAGIYDSYATGTVNAAASNVGGLVGLGSGGTVLHCHANGAVSQTVGTNAGGLLGSLFGAGIYTSFATGTVSGNGAGGLVGSALSSSIDDSFARGAVSGSGNRGGLIGFADSVTVSRAYSTGTVTSGAGSRGAFLGFAPTMPFQLVFTSCLTNIDSNPTLAPVGNTTVGNLSAVTNTALNQQATYVGWDFTAVWILGSAGAELR